MSELIKVDFTIQVLTAGSWPLQAQTSSFNIPLEVSGEVTIHSCQLEKCVNHFQAYYNTQHHGRKLSWLHHLCKGDIRALYLKKRYEFQVTNYQMATLLLFNSSETHSYESIENSTNLKASELNRTLQVTVAL